MSSLKDELDKIALALAREVQTPDCAFGAKLDAFKVLSAYHLGLLKKNGLQPDNKEATTFGEIVKQIRSVG